VKRPCQESAIDPLSEYQMVIRNAILEFGTEAVLRYREISGEPDNNVPEYFLGSCIAERLHEQFQCRVHLEHLYTDIARDLGIPASWNLTRSIGGWRADIALMQPDVPPAITELKILDEAHPPSDVENDARKLRKFAEICNIRAYVGVLICETNLSLEEQVHKVGQTLQREVYIGNIQRSVDDQWRWCFGCSALLESPQRDATETEERLCPECGKPLPGSPYAHQYCPVCRSLYSTEMRSLDTHPFPPKGRDRIAERLRDGFEAMRDDDPEDTKER
jgi:hypothetical protein